MNHRKRNIGILFVVLGVFIAGYVAIMTMQGRAVFVSDTTDTKASIRAISGVTPQVGEVIVTAEDHATTTDIPGLYTLDIPSIKVTAKVDAVGITTSGAMATAKNLSHVGWYKYGAKPGDVGTAVLAGHVNNQLLLPGTLYKLKNVQVGDDIYVAANDGTKYHYSVSALETLDYNTPDTGSVFKSTGEPELKLITCAGSWIKSEHTYDKRLIVTAKLVA